MAAGLAADLVAGRVGALALEAAGLAECRNVCTAKLDRSIIASLSGDVCVFLF